MTPQGKYPYMDELRVLAGRIPQYPLQLPDCLQRIVTPLRVDAWAALMRGHPDREFTDFLLQGMRCGFRVGFDYRSRSCTSAKRNMLSAKENPAVIDAYLTRECNLGRVVGPLPLGSFEAQVSRFGVIPKNHQPGKWRLIVDLSHPEGACVNEGIDPHLCSLSYASIDDAVRRVITFGKGTVLAKIDLESAYRIVPVHLDDRPLLGMVWKGQLFVDTALPFGLRSAPKLFTAVADGLLWVRLNQGIRSAIHYLDDYLIFGLPGSSECEQSLRIALELCTRLGVPVSTHKLEGPATSVTFLGIILDTNASELRLTEDKLTRLSALIREWKNKKSCKKRQLLSLIGQLRHAC